MITELLFRVKDIMSTDYIKMNSDDSLGSAVDKMLQFYKDEVLVLDKNDSLIGILTRYDISRLKQSGCYVPDEPVINHICRSVMTISPDFSVKEARNLMLENRIGRLPVVDNGRIVGILTSNNIRDTFYLKMNEMFDFQNNIIDSINEAVCISNEKGEVIYWNKSAEVLYNVKAEDIVGKHISVFFPNAMTLKVLKERKIIQNMQHEPVKGKSVILSAIPVFNNNKIIGVVTTDRDITEVVRLSRQLESEKEKVEFLEDAYKKEIADNYNFASICGKNKKIIDAIAVAQKVSHTSVSVLITGESGTGKEVFAKAIHEASGRSGNFVAVNCSAIPEQLLESELFGYVEGAFTGAAKKGKMGKFELANNGTLFLDEIGEMPFEMQAKLLRVLQDGVIYRLGSEKEIPTNTKIIAATNRDLKEMMKQQKFREDLFYRLAVVQIELPPLRERKEDIREFINLFINQVANKENIKIESIDSAVYNILENYEWRGNIRELKNVIQRMVVLSQDGKISISCVPDYIIKNTETNIESMENEYDLQKLVEKVEKETIKKIIDLTNGNKQKAAKMLNIKRTTLYYKLNQYGLS